MAERNCSKNMKLLKILTRDRHLKTKGGGGGGGSGPPTSYATDKYSENFDLM